MKKAYYILIAVIFLLSFRLYSSLYYPLLNSDNALSILMLYYFKLPDDLYCWGLNRIGNIIPLIGQILFKVFNFSAIASEAITRYLILLFGFLAFSSFLKSHFYKIIFALIWFFPPMRLIDITQFYFGIHYSLFAIICYLFVQYKKEHIQQNIFFRYCILTLITILLVAVIWVSDMALVSVFLLLMIEIYFYLKTNNFNSIFRKLEFYYAVIGFGMGYLFIHYAKDLSSNKQSYVVFSDPNTIKQTLNIFFSSIYELLAFKSIEPFTGVYTYLVIGIFALLIFLIKKIRLNENTRKWMLLFLLDAVLLFAIIMISNWTFLAGVPRRYFTCTYISLSFAILLLLDNSEIKANYNTIFKSILIITVLIGGIGTLYNLKYIWPKRLTPRVEYSAEFEKLGKIGVISEYWNSYITSCVNPDLIKATPYEHPSVKSYQIVEEVFQQKNMYVIKDMWLESFPDSMTQFGRLLVKDGIEFKIGDCNVCKYKYIKNVNSTRN